MSYEVVPSDYGLCLFHMVDPRSQAIIKTCTIKVFFSLQIYPSAQILKICCTETVIPNWLEKKNPCGEFLFEKPLKEGVK